MPEYTIRYILSGNGLDADKDVNIVWCSDTTEALSKLKSEDGAIAVLPQPFVTAASAQISGLRVVMDLNEAWEKINNNSKIVTGVIVVRKEFAEKYPEQLKKFIDEYNESVAYTSSNIDETAQLIAEYGIVASEAIAKKALPKCHIVCYINNNMRSALEGFLQVLYDQNPKSVGGSMPKDDSIMNINKKILNVIYKVLAVMLALILWEIAALKIDSPILLVTPVQVLGRLFTIWHEPDFAGTVWFTMYHIVGGFLAGLLCGIICAVLAYICKPVEYILWPWMVTIKAVPVASFVVICLIWFTAKNLSVFIAFLIVVPVIYQNTLTGLRSTDKGIREMADVFHIPWIRRIRYIIMPQLSPYLISAGRVTAGMAWKAGVAAEIIGMPKGSVGQMLYMSKIYLDTDDLLAWTVIIVVLSVIFEKLVVLTLKAALKK